MLAERIEQWTRQWKREGLEAGRQEGWQVGRQEGLQEGRQEGLQEGQRTLITRQLTRRFGPLPEWAVSRLEVASLDQLQNWAEAIFDAPSLEALLGEGE